MSPSLRSGVALVFGLVTALSAACDSQPWSQDLQRSGGATTRCRPDPDQPPAPGLRDRQWEPPDDDGRPTCRKTPNPPLRLDADPEPETEAPPVPVPPVPDAGSNPSGDAQNGGDAATDLGNGDGGNGDAGAGDDAGADAIVVAS